MNINETQSVNFSTLTKDELLKRDVFGRTLLHITLLVNKYDSLRNLTKNPNFKCILLSNDYENGWNCMHYVIFYNRLACLRVLLDYLKQNSIQNNLFGLNSPLIELLRCKDRCGFTPLQLLNNDFKDLVWIPEYINEKNQFHLLYRFADNRKIDKKDEETEKEVKEQQTKRVSIRSPQVPWSERRGGSDIYVLGCNSNNQLGVGDATDRSVPSKVSHDTFKIASENEAMTEVLKKPRYKQISISKNHALAVTHTGDVFSCGIGSRGRLGHGMDDLNNYFRFKRIAHFADEEDRKIIKEVAISSNHSLALTSENQVYSWGLNSYNQLGYETAPVTKRSHSKEYLDKFQATPLLVTGDLRKNYETVLGVCVSKVHSMAYSKNSLFFWGLNVGQMGISCVTGDIEVKLQDESFQGEVQKSPKMVSLRDEIKSVSTSELTTCVVTTLNDIHVYYNYQHFKLPKVPSNTSGDKQFDIFKPNVLTKAAVISKIVTRGPENSMILLNNGSVLSFSLNPSDIKNTKYSHVWKPYDYEMMVIDIDISADGSVVLCTRNGSVFLKSVQSTGGQRKNSMSGTVLPIPLAKNKFKKIESINNVVKVTCDAKFLSFGFIRDDIDLLPLKLQKNDFFKDIESLSPAFDVDLYRKQDQLLKIDHEFNTYISSFFYPEVTESIDDDELHLTQNRATSNSIEDQLATRYNNNFDPSKTKRVVIHKTYETYTQDEIDTINENFKSDAEYFKYKFADDSPDFGKSFNCHVVFKSNPGIKVGFHREIFMSRSDTFKKLVNLNDPEEHIIGEKFKANFIPDESVLMVSSDTHLLSMLLSIHTVYSGRRIDIWQSYGSRHSYPANMRLIYDEYESLLTLFKLDDKRQHKSNYLKSFRDLLDSDTGDVVLKLKDGELNAHSYILSSRSAFFETVLSTRWDNDSEFKVLDFSGLSKFQMSIVLRHIYGVNNAEILDHFDCAFNESDSFINQVLELIEISDELLLFQLKAICQSAISDLISLENVLLLLIHADYLSADKLFLNCCWYIFNNLEVLMFDPAFMTIPFEIMSKLEQQIIFLHSCRHVDFTDGHGKMSEKKEWFDKSFALLSTFVKNIHNFNDNFMSDRKGFSSFEPLVDSKYIVKKPKEDVKKKKPRKSSTTNADLAEFRKAHTVTPPQAQNISAIEDSEGSNFGFRVVQKKSKLTTKSKSPSPVPQTSNDSSKKPGPVNIPTSAPWSNQVTNSKSSISPQPQANISISGLSPHSNWASKSNASPILGDQPQSVVKVETIGSSGWKPKPAKVKIGPVVKMSQKERKRLAAAAAATAPTSTSPPQSSRKPSSSSSVAPWSAMANDKENISPIDAVSSLPVLGATVSNKKKPSFSKANKVATQPSIASQRSGSFGSSSSATGQSFASAVSMSADSSFNSVYSTPSLTEVMIQESLKVEQAKLEEAQQKSLLEIQQEQEFAKWWAEESKRVQKEMEPSKQENVKKKQGKKPSKDNKKATNDDRKGNKSARPSKPGASSSDKPKNKRKSADNKANRPKEASSGDSRHNKTSYHNKNIPKEEEIKC
ncbi:uncharacterized protein J8A68_002664 [[Candida] subhashii]|uniref:BTB domain-containing protein n=1 Tax=[Candida] subhashii TaxID=561895 RepID=A0A8J5QKW2_9ASCO|nr:uncharacterized protein J8A68_002664 [[Candida] subhashii]KAG7663804.1 hypothetical protein J8A68_002664 [[Candida] subhashii]